MWALLLLSGCFAQSTCEISESNLSPTCNFVGVCFYWTSITYTTCKCCNVLVNDQLSSSCAVTQGVFSGDNCNEYKIFYNVKFGFLIEGTSVTCANNEVESSSPSLESETVSIFSDLYPGLVQALPCVVCSTQSPCDFFEGDDATSGIYVQFGTDLNTYYDHGCGKDDIVDYQRPCVANKDRGTSAYSSIRDALDYVINNIWIFDDMHATIGFDSDTYVWQVGTSVAQGDASFTFTTPRTFSPTFSPSFEPTLTPSYSPTRVLLEETQPCEKYSNSVSDLQVLGVGSSCRANINETWPGGRGCESPYIVCLPKENTPAVEFLGRKYYNSTHRYSVAECKQECALDQRCLGFEFVADINSSLGNCTLIDDIPLGVVNEDYDLSYNSDDENLYENLNGNAVCFEKREYCNPHFTSEDLNETMLTCYCPDNRKGSYTKKVKRTVNNTRSCGDDYSMDERIKYAQANRMFHMCENWCLFNALNPELESWYWDPWKTCWRETYSADGVHRGYCDRVIRNPDSIELKFVNDRSSKLLSCNITRTPTEAPVNDVNTTYFLGEELESCDDACSRNSLLCAADQTARRFSSENELIEAFAEAGHACDVDTVTMNDTRLQGWALPGLERNSFCTNRQLTLSHLEDLDSDCHRIIGENWQRLCACY